MAEEASGNTGDLGKYHMSKKVLITGLGSIGQRHARCLREMYGDRVELHAFRSRGLRQVINDDMTIIPDVSPVKHYGIIEHDDMDSALAKGMDAVFVTNPPDLHVTTAQRAVQAGAHIFIEKPLSHSMKGVDLLISETKKAGLVCMVGHQLRYHVLTKKIREIISEGLLGKMTSAGLVFAEYLPGMHPYEDYRLSHAASEQRGGGAILSLDHDIDIACHLFGLPNRLFCMGGHYSKLEIGAEDTAHVLMEISYEDGPMTVHLHLDFIQRPTRREWTIIGELGSIHANLVDNTLSVDTYHGGCHKNNFEQFPSFERNSMFKDEIKEFFKAVETKTNSSLGLQEARDILKVTMAAKKSLSIKESVCLK